MHAKKVGELFGKQGVIGVPFAGGLSEIPYFDARQILVNDKNNHLYNLWHVLTEDPDEFQFMLENEIYHPETLSTAKSNINSENRFDRALAYFICNWMTRCAGGTDSETDGSLAMRWTASGGSSIARWRAAVEGLPKWAEILRTKCECTCLDWQVFAKKWKDRKGHALYVDCPWIKGGEDYVHKFNDGDHFALAQWLDSLTATTIVVRHHDCDQYRNYYSESNGWEWFPVDAVNQAGGETGECLIRKRGGK